MTIRNRIFHRHTLIALLLLVFSTNMALYYTSFGRSILGDNPDGIVIGSIFDLAIIMPALFIIWKRKRTVKNIIFSIAFGLILTRFLIPMDYLAPYESITWVGFGIEAVILLVEGSILLFELYLIFILVKYLPAAIRHVKESDLPLLFSFHDFLDKHVSTKPIIKIICTELLMFYYAFASWRRKPKSTNTNFTLHKSSSMIAVYLMLIHSILIETIVIHWWLHSKAPIISIILLILNIYSIVFFIGHLQAIRHNPIQITKEKIYLSFGLLKRMKIKTNNIAAIIRDPKVLQNIPVKNTIEFIARDFEETKSNVVIQLKDPEKASLFFGLEKEYHYVAIRADEAEKLTERILQCIATQQGADHFE